MRFSIIAAVLVLLAACSSSGDGPADLGRADSGPNDAGGGDTGAVDSGGGDSGATDFGATDGGDVDSGSADLGAADAGPDMGGNVGDACGARLGDTCVGGTWCRWALGDLCGAADAPGHCAYPTNPTTCPMSGPPVCASDGLTYDNECLANAVMQSACSSGACTPTP